MEIDGSGTAPRRARGKRSTDENGLAVWEPVVAGNWSLRVRSVAPKSRVVAPDEMRAEVVVDPGRTAWHEFALLREGTVIVRLRDVPHAEQLLSVSLHGEHEMNKGSVQTTVESAIRAIKFTWHVSPGERVLAVEWKPDSPWWSRPQTVTIEPGQTTYPSIEALASDLRASGRVRDALGVPVAGVGVSIRDRN